MVKGRSELQDDLQYSCGSMDCPDQSSTVCCRCLGCSSKDTATYGCFPPKEPNNPDVVSIERILGSKPVMPQRGLEREMIKEQMDIKQVNQ